MKDCLEFKPKYTIKNSYGLIENIKKFVSFDVQNLLKQFVDNKININKSNNGI